MDGRLMSSRMPLSASARRPMPRISSGSPVRAMLSISVAACGTNSGRIQCSPIDLSLSHPLILIAALLDTQVQLYWGVQLSHRCRAHVSASDRHANDQMHMVTPAHMQAARGTVQILAEPSQVLSQPLGPAAAQRPEPERRARGLPVNCRAVDTRAGVDP